MGSPRGLPRAGGLRPALQPGRACTGLLRWFSKMRTKTLRWLAGGTRATISATPLPMRLPVGPERHLGWGAGGGGSRDGGRA
eukprot:6632523-Alexandrium_andersonii.AAC.1